MHPAFPDNHAILQALLIFGLLTFIVYFVSILLFPDLTWVTIDLLLQFQATKVCIYALYFGLGIYAYSGKWVVNEYFFGRPAVWAFSSLALLIGYLIVGQDIFAHPENSQTLPPMLLLAFAFVRSFLCLSFLVWLLSFAFKYGKHPSAINRELSTYFLNIYLVHFFYVIAIQEILANWQDGLIAVKIGIVFFMTIPSSYGTSRLINRFPNGTISTILGLFVLVALTTY